MDLGEERKLTSAFFFAIVCGASEGFMKVLNGLIKPFVAPQRSLKRNIQVVFNLNATF